MSSLLNKFIILTIQAKPNSKKPGIEKLSDAEWIVRLKSPPIDGKANEELIERIAFEFKIAKSKVVLLKGESGKKKKIQVSLPY
jgi:uncharacterized protein (TIGR00251 family)